MRAAIAIALLAAAGCSTPPPAEPAPAEPDPRAPVAAKRSDAMARADQIAAEAARREAEYQQSVQEGRQPKSEVPVVMEFSPQVAAVPAYASGGSAPRPEEAWWRAQMEPLRQEWHKHDAAFRDANARWRAADKMKMGPEKDSAIKKAIADQQRADAGARAALQVINQLREKAKQMNVPVEWVQWP